MEKDDARKLSPAEQHERRRQVIRAYKRGRTRTQIAQDVGLSYTTVSKTIARFEIFGLASLAPRTRGRRSGEDRALSVEQEQAIQRTISICDKRPEQLKMDFACGGNCSRQHCDACFRLCRGIGIWTSKSSRLERLHQHTHRRLVARTLDEVALPMARHQAVLNLGRTHMDARHLGNLSGVCRAKRALVPPMSASRRGKDSDAAVGMGGQVAIL